MKPIEFKIAYYVKLGEKGLWEESSIRENRIRIGWHDVEIRDIKNGNWTGIKQVLDKTSKSKSLATRDFNALKHIVESNSEDIWVTFHASQLWWCKVDNGQIFEDGISKYRACASKWLNRDIDGHLLILNQIPGMLSQTQRFAGTICHVTASDALRRLINNQPSVAYSSITAANSQLITEVEQGIKLLHWKDFETLVDLVFRQAGWRRASVLGETMKYADLELEEPVTGDMYQVQVKSTATFADFRKYADDFTTSAFRKLYFVVHSPIGRWGATLPSENVVLMLPAQVAEMVVRFGLTSWLLRKIR